MSRVAVIGAGVGGLAVAARLSALGHDVTVFERSDTIGGKLGVWEHDGFVFDTGPSLLTMPFVFEELFNATGAPLSSVVQLQRLDPIAHYRWADGTQLDASTDVSALCRALDDVLGPGNGDDWQRLHDRGRRIWEATYEPFLAAPLDGVRTLARLAGRVGDIPVVAPWQTMRGLAESHLRDPRLRMFFERYATYTGSDPRRAPAALAAIPYAEQHFGAWYVAGGLHRLGQAIRDRAAERGARIRTGVEVAGITVSGGSVDGIRLVDGTFHRADVVVSDADATRVYSRLLRNPRRARPLRNLRRATPSLSGFALFLGIRGRTPGLAHHTVLFPSDYDAEFDAIFQPAPRPVSDPTVYVSAPRDPTITPPGNEAWYVLVNAPRHGPVDWSDTALVHHYRDRVLGILAARGLDVRERIVSTETRSPADLERLTAAPGGAIYGTSSNGPLAAFLRPANRSPVPGLFLVGGSAHPGGGLPLVTLSARIVAGLVGRA